MKAEIDSWSMFEAATVVPYQSMARGASIIPLGELFSVKRNGKKKFRQYAMGNLLKGRISERPSRQRYQVMGLDGFAPSP